MALDKLNANRRNIASRISQLLSKFGLEHAVSGGKFDDLRQTVSDKAGYWENTSFAAKPSRLLVNLEVVSEVVVAKLPADNANGNFAYANTARRSVGALVVRVLPLVKEPDGKYRPHPECEWLLWYCFWPKLANGTSGQLFDGFDPESGTFTYMGSQQPYIASGLVALNHREEEVRATDGTLLYTYWGATEALQRLITVNTSPLIAGATTAFAPQRIEVYDANDPNDIARMAQVIESAFEQASASHEDEDDDGGIEEATPTAVPIFDDLIGIDPEVYRQINGALAAGIRHLLFYGPPGTGKTTLAQRTAAAISDQWKLITGSSDWTSQDIIGGYHPLAGGNIKFMPGVLLENFDKPLIFDELNRCDIDKVIGPLFTVLSGQGTTLPYLTDASDINSSRIEILPKGQASPPNTYAPTPKWRLIATINSIDKASLYQMSYALTRRFAWIYVDVPRDPRGFVRQYVARQLARETAPHDSPVPLGDLWEAVNQVRAVGPAPILDIIRLILALQPTFDFFSDINAPEGSDPYLDGFCVFLLPMLDGILRDQGERLAESLVSALHLGTDERAVRLKNRIVGLTI